MAAAQRRNLSGLESAVAEFRARSDVDLELDAFCLAQILSAFGRLSVLERMWNEFELAQQQQPALIDFGAV